MELLLPASTEYALRAMACLAATDPNKWVPSYDLVDATHVPPAYLSKVLRRLVEAGLLASIKGHHGGFRLARPAQDIRLADVLQAMKDGPPDRRCMFGFERCSSAEPCPLHPFFDELNHRLEEWSEQVTLADLDGASYLAKPIRRAVGGRRR